MKVELDFKKFPEEKPPEKGIYLVHITERGFNNMLYQYDGLGKGYWSYVDSIFSDEEDEMFNHDFDGPPYLWWTKDVEELEKNFENVNSNRTLLTKTLRMQEEVFICRVQELPMNIFNLFLELSKGLSDQERCELTMKLIYVAQRSFDTLLAMQCDNHAPTVWFHASKPCVFNIGGTNITSLEDISKFAEQIDKKMEELKNEKRV